MSDVAVKPVCVSLEFAPEPILAVRRLFAFVLDLAFLRLVGMAFGAAYGDEYAKMGNLACISGFWIAMTYFAGLQCYLGDGQTFGQMLMKVRVVNARGQRISILRAVIRFTILWIPVFLSGLVVPISIQQGSLETIWLILVVSLLMGVALYFVMNVSGKQSLHDRICGTYVVGSRHTGPVIATPGSQFCLKKAMLAICLILLGMCPVLYQFWGTESETKFKHSLGEIKQGDLIQIKQEVAETPMGRFHYLRLVAVPNAKVKPQALADEVGKAALKYYRGIDRFDLVVVDIRTGYNLGIHRSYLDTSWCLSPVQWSKEIGKPVHHKRVIPLL